MPKKIINNVYLYIYINIYNVQGQQTARQYEFYIQLEVKKKKKKKENKNPAIHYYGDWNIRSVYHLIFSTKNLVNRNTSLLNKGYTLAEPNAKTWYVPMPQPLRQEWLGNPTKHEHEVSHRKHNMQQSETEAYGNCQNNWHTQLKCHKTFFWKLLKVP